MKPSSASGKWKKPSTGVVVVAVLVAVAGWNTLLADESDDSGKTPAPQPSGSSAPAVSGR